MEEWPSNSPDRLEDICLCFCVHNIHSLTKVKTNRYIKPSKACETGGGDSTASDSLDIHVIPEYEFHSDVVLPKTICDKLFHLISEQHHGMPLSLIGIFLDINRTRLSAINLRSSNITDAGLNLLQNHQVTELELNDCPYVTSDCIKETINSYFGENLKSLKIENNSSFLSDLNFDHVDFMEDSTEELFGRDFIFKCPNLRILRLRDVQLYKLINEEYDLLDVILYRLTKLTHLDISRCDIDLIYCCPALEVLEHLTSLNVADIRMDDVAAVFSHLGRLKNLRHLDISQSDEEVVPVVYDGAELCFPGLIQNLPRLISLDISGTNLAGFLKPEVTSHTLGPAQERMDDGNALCAIPGLEGRHFEFLGLLGCSYKASERENIPATKVTGDSNEDQLLLSIQVYLDRPQMLIRALNSLFQLFRYTGVQKQCTALNCIIAALKRHNNNSSIQISGSASLFYIIKGTEKQHISMKQKRAIIDVLLDGMESFLDEQTMVRNACLTLCHFSIPHDLLYCYERVVKVLLEMLKQDFEVLIPRIGIFLLNSLACEIDAKHKRLVGELGAVDVMIEIIKKKLEAVNCDEIMEVAWSTLWNVTDETDGNCKRFLENNGMELFMKCLREFPNQDDLHRNMMGLMGNIAEVKALRPRLMQKDFVGIFSDLLTSQEDVIEVSYNAAGVLSHMATDGVEAWTVEEPSREEVMYRLVSAIERWPLDSTRNINYRSFEPILRLVRANEVKESQYWAVWALCNLTNVYPEKYCKVLQRENGLAALKNISEESKRFRKMEHYIQTILETLKRFDETLHEDRVNPVPVPLEENEESSDGSEDD